MRAWSASPLVGKELRRVREQLPNVSTRVAAIFRRGRPILPTGGTIIEADDEVFFIAAAGHINAVMAGLREVERAFKRVTIAGGGQIGERLAQAIEPYFSVKLVEYNPRRCAELGESLNRTVVLQGDVTDRDLLLDENIEQCDAFCAVTNDDESEHHVVADGQAPGRAPGVMTLIGKQAYVDIVEGGEIDIAISPQQSTTSSLLTHVRARRCRPSPQPAAGRRGSHGDRCPRR